MSKYICVHCHYYQPSRENPWTNIIDDQETAAPYRNWNERINEECYRPNARTEVEGKVCSNYEKVSYNFGPTLMSWIREHDPETYQAIIEADKKSQERFSGHGSAIAQAYHHIILPLANGKDKRTQIYWGIEDFKLHFQRDPVGMWIPETAVDYDTLEILAEYNIQFTILAPNQADQVKEIQNDQWQKIGKQPLDISMPYLCRLPSGREITIFFYNGPISNEVAFEKLLKSGEGFAERLIREFDHPAIHGELIHIATDGETYGHHHKFGEMALSYMLQYVEENQMAQLTNYSEFLNTHPPTHEVKISENTSWSCSHGVERWRSDCGCKIGTKKNTTQEWREHLREALDWLRDRIAPEYEKLLSPYFDDPWDVRTKYVHILNETATEKCIKFLTPFANVEIRSSDFEAKIKPSCEMQRMLMMMYTSCGWFFDDVSGLETVQILRYAARAMEYFEELTGISLEEEFLGRLQMAESNHPQYKNGREVYLKLVKNEPVAS